MNRGSKINNIEGAIMIIVAVVFDGMQALVTFLNAVPFIGTILAVTFNKILAFFAILTFFTWLAIKMVGWKPMVSLFTGGAIELIPIPFLSALPFFTGVIIAIVILDRAKGRLRKILPVK